MSVALVAPDEAQRWVALLRALGAAQPPPTFPVDATLMPQVGARGLRSGGWGLQGFGAVGF